VPFDGNQHLQSSRATEEMWRTLVYELPPIWRCRLVRDHGRRPSMAARDRERCGLAGGEWRIVSGSQRKWSDLGVLQQPCSPV